MIITGMTRKGLEDEFQGMFTSAKAMEVQASLLEGNVEGGGTLPSTKAFSTEDGDELVPIWKGPEAPEGCRVIPIIEVFHEAGDPKHIRTTRCHGGTLSERGAGRLITSLDGTMEKLEGMKLNAKKSMGKIGKGLWKLSEKRKGDTLILVGFALLQKNDEGNYTGDLDRLRWATFPRFAQEKTPREDIVPAVMQVLFTVVDRSRTVQAH